MSGALLKMVKAMIKYKNNIYGRSMIEMLGVLSVIGVISVGGFKMVAQALQSQRYTQAITDAAQLAEDGRRLVCDYRDDTGYHSIAYGIFLYKSGKYPGSLTYDATSNVYEGVLDITYAVSTLDTSGAFKITIANVPKELCIRMAVNDWGTMRSSGLTNIKIGNTSATSFTPDTAVTACTADSNTVELSYKGCQ